MQVFVQKCVVGSPSDEHSVADMLPEQSERLAQNFPTPTSLPVSPGMPHVDGNASTLAAASGVFLVESLLPHAIVTTAAMAAITTYGIRPRGRLM